MSIEDKLRDILFSRALGGYYRDADGNFVPVDWENSPVIEQYVDEIKQAFSEEDEFVIKNMSFEDANKYTLTFSKPLADYTDIRGKHVTILTGQDFYDRFWQIYNEERNPQLADSTIVREQVDKIAKRAAGLE
jgi:hypothetical protein